LQSDPAMLANTSVVKGPIMLSDRRFMTLFDYL
jgi:hypothetical protein